SQIQPLLRGSNHPPGNKRRFPAPRRGARSRATNDEVSSDQLSHGSELLALEWPPRAAELRPAIFQNEFTVGRHILGARSDESAGIFYGGQPIAEGHRRLQLAAHVVEPGPGYWRSLIDCSA